MELKFYICRHCGKIIAPVNESGVPVMCCGEKMTEIIPCSTDGAVEKHLPVYSADGGIVKVSVGSAAHPMTDAHYIQWIAVQTKYGNQRHILKPDDKPEACFALCEGDEVTAVYAYCNLHGLWRA